MISILLPTDFSSNSMNAIKYALEFFKHQKAKFYFMHAYQNAVYDQDNLVSRNVFDEILENVSSESRRNLKALLAEVKMIAPNPEFEFHIISSYSTLLEEVNIIADAKNIDLIVMGTKGKSNQRNLIYGSNTFKVLKYVKCPVLAIPAHYSNTRPKNILFPTNYMIPYKSRELKLLKDLATSFKSVIDVLHVSKSDTLSIRQKDNKALIKETIDKTEVLFSTVNSKRIPETIKRYIKHNATDLLVMINTQHSFLEDMLFQSKIDKVGIDLKIPLLAMQNAIRPI